MDSDDEASRRHYGAEQEDARRRPLQPRRRHATAKKLRGKAVRGGRDPQHKNRLRTDVGIFIQGPEPGKLHTGSQNK